LEYRVQNCSSRTTWLVLLLVAVSPLAVLGSPKYPIQLDRPVKVGDSFNVRIKFHSQATKKLKTSNGQDKDTTQGFDLDFAGIEDVLSISDGVADKLRFVVEHCTLGGQVLIAQGRTILVESTPKGIAVSVSGKAVEPHGDLYLVLRPLLLVKDPRRPLGHDAVFGSKEQRAIGDIWAVDPGVIVQMLSVDHLIAAKENVDGSVKLASIEGVDSNRSLRIVADVNATHLRGETGAIKVVEGSTHFEDVVVCPIDLSKPVTGSTQAYEMHVKLSGKDDDGQYITGNMDLKENVQYSIEAPR